MTANAPFDSVTLAARFYSDPALYDAERTAVFARSWLLVAHEGQLPNPGDYLALSVAGFPFLILRDSGGAIVAFHNVCRHRAGPLVFDGAGNCEKGLVCRYHGWRYALDGRLTSARDFGRAEEFDARKNGLFRLACDNWRGFVFVNMQQDTPPLGESLGEIDARAGSLDAPAGQLHHVVHDIDCNWKTYVENYLEGYHIPLVHPLLDASVDAARYTVEVVPPAVFHSAPPREGAAMRGLWAWMWPCLGINFYSHCVLMERIWPLSVSRTRLDYLYVFARDASREQVKATLDASVATTAEDKSICESVQRNLDAGVYRNGTLSPKHEKGVAWFQRQIESALKSGDS